ncbi:MAG: permease [Pseudodesulfovibrio sp.]|uniref:Permease n=1 Tax=Pseudodesulfovibrio aespoeensis (strain ATCC 700646 / DSM 10631 / Aspo-2) TaxID=643562 RepID=E6VSP4_PSEA9|nr:MULTISPECIES: permease [Pseudodesulfovibrio]MBU4193059.1 permease [Pseudomonadota bacterium]MCG2732892.1 permease [Pseudodesulfovibrio aespoeensis]ADU62029.1 permease [Pseudodesulfovibrio aespoeensis Aspo-2]MBU4244674.1 permease [Pseudomonadota bacterium]MBU4378926.1 permease [Pseudomonadota bacterium]
MIESLVLMATAATAIVLEAAPFLLLGSLIGSLIEVLVPERTLLRVIPRSGVGQVATGIFAGMLLPTCECGIVPVVRRLLLKNVPPRVAIPYMMAAPVVNPVVLGSTLFAFQGDLTVVGLRVLLVIIPAAALGFALGNAGPRSVLRQRPIDLKRFGEAEAELVASHDAHEWGGGCGCDHGAQGAGGKARAVLFHTAAEFISMGRFLVFGAVVAAGFKAFLPPSVLGLFADNPLLAVGGLMLLAIALSICSEADAFVAASFASFPVSAKVAFMAIGPMVDLKLIPLFLTVFNRRVALALIVVPVVTVYVMAAVLAVGGG